jgi:beta-galactosidase
LGGKTMEPNGHLEWAVNYAPGTLEAIGHKKGEKTAVDIVKTTGESSAIMLSANKQVIKGNKEDLAIITVQVDDKNNLAVPTAANEITFSIEGPAKIIGVGNGDNTSLEPDRYFEKISIVGIEELMEKTVAGLHNNEEIAADYNDSKWSKAFKDERDEKFGQTVKALVYRGSFYLPDNESDAAVTFYYNSLGKMQSVYINGKELGHNFEQNRKGNEFKLDKTLIHPGKNTIAIVATPLTKKHSWDNINSDPGLVQLVYPAAQWKRKLFNGLAQVIVQSTGGSGQIVLTATASDVKKGEIKVGISPAKSRDIATMTE